MTRKDQDDSTKKEFVDRINKQKGRISSQKLRKGNSYQILKESLGMIMAIY